MDSLYPAGPETVPAGLSAPTSSYRRQAWLAMLGLLAFILLYLGLLGWFAWTAYRLVHGLAAGTAGGGMALLSLLVAGCSAFLAFFMAKALVFRRRAHAPEIDVELTPQQQPELFAFLHRLADEARAPRPYRVFLSPRVNAGVFYDLSLLNLIFPSRKNLEIGMGLVNVLSLGELKAVLAHEFGHFAQRTMAVGRWVYVAQQMAGHIVAKRDALDTVLATLSRMDFRIAWIGWSLSLVIWSIRSLVEIVFRWVVIAQRALSREMEFQADLVAASLTGSDALVHALHRLGAADEAWERALQFAGREAAQGRPVKDIYDIQARIIERLRDVLNAPDYGQSPLRPAGTDASAHRVFQAALAPPPQMWATHPSSDAREQNVKRVYVSCPIDERPATALLRDARTLKESLSIRLLREKPESFPDAAVSHEHLDREYQAIAMSRRYRGAYLGRSFVRAHERIDALYEPVPANTDLAAAIDALYPEAAGPQMERLRELDDQFALLDAIRQGRVQTQGDTINWRGEQLPRKRMPQILQELDAERAPLRKQVDAHDRRCRSLHLAAAERLGGTWAAALRGQLAVLHYAEHAAADLVDARALFENTYAVITADNRVSQDELRRLVASCNQVHAAIDGVYARASQVVLDDAMTTRLEGKRWSEMLEHPLGLPRATEQNINGWLKAMGGWADATAGALGALRHAALEALLTTEDHVALQLRTPDATPAPAIPASAPREYPLALPGKERKRQHKLGLWDSFQTATGAGPAAVRLVVAGGIIGSVFLLGGAVGHATLTVYNALAREVKVQVDDQEILLGANTHQEVTLADSAVHRVSTRTADTNELIEQFEEKSEGGGSQLIYNVASAAPLVEWTASYGNAAEVPERRLGAPRWSSTGVDHIFSEPPASISSKSGSGTRTALAAVADRGPDQAMNWVASGSKDANAVVTAHARWDLPSARHTQGWLAAADQMNLLQGVIQDRLRQRPDDVGALRMEQEMTQGEAHDRVCARHTQMAQAANASSSLHYVAARCIVDTDARDEAFLAGQQRWPQDPWFAMAAGYTQAERQQWSQARELFGQAARAPELGEWVALDLARVMRQGGDPSPAEMQALASQSTALRSMLAFESGTPLPPEMRAYDDLVHGRLPAAYSSAPPEDRARVLRMIAGSDGATDELTRQALALPATEGIDGYTVYPALALAMREGADASALRAAAVKLEPEPDGERIVAFLDAVKAGASRERAEAALGNVSPRARGLAYAAAVVLRGDQAPQAWRDGAKRLLFAAERPYFG